MPSHSHDLTERFYLIVLWPLALCHEERIVADIRSKLPIVADTSLQWPGDPERCFARFYGCKACLACGKAEQVGGSEFRLIVVRDDHPVFRWRETSRGHERVNDNIFELKTRYRRWTGGGHAIHTTNTPEESRRDFYLLTGQTLSEFSASGEIHDPKVLPGANGWRSFHELFRALGESLRYVVLRNSEMLPDRFDPTLHGDIDLLVDDECECACALGARKIFDEPQRVHYEVLVNDRPVRFDFRHVGDRYYDSRWQRDILDRRVLGADGIYRPDTENAFYSLVYHATLQKFIVAPDYPRKIAELARNAGLSIRGLDDAYLRLEDFIQAKGYRCERPLDSSVFFDDDLLNWRQTASDIESVLPVSDLRLIHIACRKPKSVMRTFFFTGIDEDGRSCFVKHMPDNPECMKNEWIAARAFQAVSDQHCAAPRYYNARADGAATIVYEQLIGFELAAALRDRSISSQQAEDLSDQLLSISDALKRVGFCHRDIRPENLFLTNDWQLKLIDFQFAIPFNAKSEASFALNHWEKILLSLGERFRVKRGLWNDALSLAKCLALLPDFLGKSKALAALETDAPERYFAVRLPRRMIRHFRLELTKMRFRNFRHKLTHRPLKNLDQIEFMEVACGGFS